MFKNWCVSQKLNGATNLSHVLMDGGVLSVPFDKLNDFYEKYIEAIVSGENCSSWNRRHQCIISSWT